MRNAMVIVAVLAWFASGRPVRFGLSALRSPIRCLQSRRRWPPRSRTWWRLCRGAILSKWSRTTSTDRSSADSTTRASADKRATRRGCRASGAVGARVVQRQSRRVEGRCLRRGCRGDNSCSSTSFESAGPRSLARPDPLWCSRRMVPGGRSCTSTCRHWRSRARMRRRRRAKRAGPQGGRDEDGELEARESGCCWGARCCLRADAEGRTILRSAKPTCTLLWPRQRAQPAFRAPTSEQRVVQYDQQAPARCRAFGSALPAAAQEGRCATPSGEGTRAEGREQQAATPSWGNNITPEAAEQPGKMLTQKRTSLARRRWHWRDRTGEPVTVHKIRSVIGDGAVPVCQGCRAKEFQRMPVHLRSPEEGLVGATEH